MNSIALPTDGGSVVSATEPLPNARHEQFAQAVAAGESYKAAYLSAFKNGTTLVRNSASALAARPEVQARVRAIQLAAARANQADVRTYLQRLASIASADPGELARVVTEPCVGANGCWSTEAVAAVLDAAAATNAAMPDLTQPRPSCERCGGQGVRRVEIRATDELSASGRALMKAIRMKSDGSIEIAVHDQLAATRLLAELSGWIVSQNANLNLNATVPNAPAPVSPEDALKAFHALRRVTSVQPS